MEIKLECEDVMPGTGLSDEFKPEWCVDTQSEKSIFVKKIETKYVNVAIALLSKKIDSSWFANIEIRDNKTEPFSWVIINGSFDEMEDIMLCNLPQKVRTALKEL